METIRRIEENRNPAPPPQPSNDNDIKRLAMGRSIFPDGAVARIYCRCPSVTTARKPRKKRWCLVFERRTAPLIEPLTGYTGGDDPLAQVELEFPDLESAVAYARCQGLNYVVQPMTERSEPPGRNQPATERASHAFSDATLERLGLAPLGESYGLALDGAVRRGDPSGPESWSSPVDIVGDPKLPLAAKRSILMNWAWTEYLIDQATNEGMPENNRPSRLDEVEQALLVLERQVEAEMCPSSSVALHEVRPWIHSSSI